MQLYLRWIRQQLHHDVAVVDGDGHVMRTRARRQRCGRVRAIVDTAGRGRRHRRAPDPGSHRNRPRPVGGRPARDRPGDLSDQPAGGLAVIWARYAVSGAESDATDAVLLANIVRTERRRAPPAARRHRAGPGDPGTGPRPQDAVWARQQIGNQIRDLLKEFYPAALVAFAELPAGGLARADARTILGGRTHPRGCHQADPSAAAEAAGQGWPPPRLGS